MKTTSSEHARTGKSMNNLLSYCGLVNARIRASDKDLPVLHTTIHRWKLSENTSGIGKEFNPSTYVLNLGSV